MCTSSDWTQCTCKVSNTAKMEPSDSYATRNEIKLTCESAELVQECDKQKGTYM